MTIFLVLAGVEARIALVDLRLGWGGVAPKSSRKGADNVLIKQNRAE